MIKDEKYKAILSRANVPESECPPLGVSVMVIMEYMETLFKNGIIADGQISLTPSGKIFANICQEFDWKPTDTEIAQFCKDMVEEAQQAEMVLRLIALRDDREKFLKNAKRHTGF